MHLKFWITVSLSKCIKMLKHLESSSVCFKGMCRFEASESNAVSNTSYLVGLTSTASNRGFDKCRQIQTRSM